MTRDDVLDLLDILLEDESFGDVLEYFDLTKHNAFWILFESGHIDEELLKEMAGK